MASMDDPKSLGLHLVKRLTGDDQRHAGVWVVLQKTPDGDINVLR